MQKIKGYKELTRHELSQLFNKNIAEFVFDYNDKPSENERKSAMVVEHEEEISLKHFPKVASPKHISTPDFATVDDCVVLEVKSTGSIKNGFNNAYKQAKKQFSNIKNKHKKIVFVNVDNIPSFVKNDDIIENAVACAFAHNIDYFIVVRMDKIICEKL